MRHLSKAIFALATITVSSPVTAGEASSSTSTGAGLQVAAPRGFDDLTAPRTLSVDLYFAGEKVGEALARLQGGSLEFNDAEAVAQLIPNLKQAAAFLVALRAPLPGNVALACGRVRTENCGRLPSNQFGIIFDEERYRVDLFVPPEMLGDAAASAPTYLADPSDSPSFVSLLGATASGSIGQAAQLHLQNRTIASMGPARLRTDAAVASDGLVFVDHAALETERSNWRFMAGTYWAPGLELLGRNKIVGVGASTQLDTRLDKQAALATPVYLFLQRPGKVDLLLDGRLVASRLYEAGNQLIDTSSLPDGSYELTLRAQEEGADIVEERRHFSRGSALAPINQPLISVHAGFLQDGLGVSGVDFDNPYVSAAGAIRLNSAAGVDAKLVATHGKVVVETGATALTPLGQLRVGGLLSNSADYGLLVQAHTTASKQVYFSFDLRAIKSQDENPILPVSRPFETFGDGPVSGIGNRASVTQAIGVLGYRLRSGTLRLSGHFRDQGSDYRTYGLSGTLDLPVVRSMDSNVWLQAEVRKSDRDNSALLSVRFFRSSGSVSTSGSVGLIGTKGGSKSAVDTVGNLQLSHSAVLGEFGQVISDGAVGSDSEGQYARVGSSFNSPQVRLRAESLHAFRENGRTQFAATLNTGLVASSEGVQLGASGLTDAAIAVGTEGAGPDQRFDVLIDDVVRGSISGDKRLLLFVNPFRQYDVRLRASGAALSAHDSASRQVTVYPGNVSNLSWNVAPIFVVFGKAVDESGRILAGAEMKGAHGVGRTDGTGRFQIEANAGDVLTVLGPEGNSCRIFVRNARPVDGLWEAGELPCERESRLQ